jgi:enoyl-CoA hydratase/carnithine racemase
VVFVAGADINEFTKIESAEQALALSRETHELFRRIELAPKPFIAAINGLALGGGLELAMACHLRVIGERAKVGQPEINLGIIPGAGGTQRLPRLVGPARAKDLVMSGRMVGAEEALAIGLVDRVVPPAEVYGAAVELVAHYVKAPAQALRAAKLAIDGGLSMDLAAGLAWESQLFAALFATQDKVEGMAAFVEKRKANFTGR